MPTLSLDFSQIWEQAVSFANMLWPVFVVPIGIVLGVGILNFVVKAVKGALAHF